MSITINCNSTLDVADISFTVKRFLPLNKFIMVHKFVSFLEIDAGQLGLMGIDCNSPDVKGLYTKLNPNTGRMMYCFAVEYQPLIKLESYNNNVSDKMAKNYSLTLEVTYYIQEPMFLVFQETHEIERVNMAYLRIGHDPISSFSINELKNTTPKGKKYNKVIKNIIIHDMNYHNARQLSETINNEEKEFILFDLKLDKHDFILCENHLYNIFNINGVIDNNIPVYEYNSEENKVTFKFNIEDFYNKYNPTLTTPIIFQICEETSR